MSVRWAFIGAGRHPRLWLAPALANASNGTAVGVWSRRREQSQSFADEYDVGRVYPDLDALLGDSQIDAVCIATPNSLHASHAISAMRAGKHVLCEKPMATSILDAVEMLRVAHATGRILGVGFHLRHNLVVEEVEQKVRAGTIGNVKYATAQFNLTSSPPPRLQIPHAIWKRDPEQMGGAGALMGMGVHLIDLLRFVVGSEVCAVQAAAVGMTQESPLESFGQVLLEFDSGAQAHLAYGGSFPLSRNDAVVYGERGRVIAKDVIDVATGGKLELLLIDDATGAGTEANQPAAVDHYQRQFEAFNNALLRGTPFRADGVDGLQAVQVACAIIQAQRSGQRVWVGENLAIDLNRNAPE